MLTCAANPQAVPVSPASLVGDRDRLPPAQVLAGDGFGTGADFLDRASRDDPAAVDARAGADVDDMVGRAHGLLVMLHDDQRIAEIAQLLERPQQLFVVALVQADAGLVQDIEDAHQARTDLGSQADALRLAAGERRRRAGERQVAETDAGQKAQPRPDLLQNPLRDHAVFLVEREMVDKFQRFHDGKIREIRDAHSAHRDGEGGFFQALAVALRAIHLRHALLDIRAHGGTLRLAVAALEIVDDALKLPLDDAVAFAAFIAELERFALRAVEDGVHGVFGKVLQRVGQLEMVALGQRLEIHAGDGVAFDIVPAGGHDPAVHDGEIGVRHNELGIDQQLHAEAGAGRAGAVGVIEGEEAGRQLLNRDAAVLTGIVLGKAQDFFPARVDIEDAAGEGQRRLRRIRQAAHDFGLDHEAVHDDFDIVLFILFQADVFAEIVDDPVDARADVAGFLRVLQNLDMLALLAADHRRQDLQLRPLRQGHDAVDDLIDGLLADLLPALRAVRNADTRPEKTHIVINLRHRAHRGARVFGGSLLVDGDGRG